MAGLLLKNARRRWTLYAEETPTAGAWFPLAKAETVIGRHSPADIVLPAPHVSRTEARIVCQDGAYYLENITSRNATMFKGKKIRCSGRQLLEDGDEILVGDYEFVFLERNGAAPGVEMSSS
jgi:pSer/pThr/pTyr-binding forkhead associated (FHA) protein